MDPSNPLISTLVGLKRYWFVGLIGFLALIGALQSSDSSLPPPATQPTYAANTSAAPDLTPGFSLPTGTIIKKHSAYLQGEGELTIKNGTDYDAVAKLISGTQTSGTSVLSVYIKAQSTYTMQSISDGIYWLAFAQGTDWDPAGQKFNRNAHAQAFAETFDFETTDRQYSAWSVTLNPVAGGTARTAEVDAAQFDAY